MFGLMTNSDLMRPDGTPEGV